MHRLVIVLLTDFAIAYTAQVFTDTFVIDAQDLPGDAADTSVLTSEAWTIGLPIDIPWLGARHDHSSYPLCPSLSSYVAIRRPKGTVHSLHDDAALWLSAMTFGLLEAITCMRIPQCILLVPGINQEETVISGSRVLQALILWSHRKDQDLEGGHSGLERRHEVTQLLRKALRALAAEHRGAASILSYAGILQKNATEIYCGIAHLVIILGKLTEQPPSAIEDYWNSLDLRTRPSSSRRSLLLWYRQILLATGWCPYTLSALGIHQAGVLDAVVILVPHLLRLQPYVRTQPGEHATCREDFCVVYTITDTEAYKPRHTRPNCECVDIRPTSAEVYRLLDGDDYPVVVYEGSTLRVIPAQETSYVAISHVWSEGMGSTTEHGLPTCLVEYISSLARRLLPEHGGAFWMDSLCVPQHRLRRKRAISRMADTYRNAAKVLVIDDSIRTLYHPERSSEPDIILRFAASGWMRRVWTLQEGLLARELYFECMEGITEINIHAALSPWLCPLVLLLCIRADAASAGQPTPSVLEPLSMMFVVLLLNGRATTKAEDELVAISSLLAGRVKVDELLAEKDGPDLVDRRMKKFLLQMRDIPLGVPFGPRRRSTLDGFSWAPYMLSGDHHENWVLKPSVGTGICTEEGLVGRFPLALLDKPITLPSHTKAIHPAIAKHVMRPGVLVRHSPSGNFLWIMHDCAQGTADWCHTSEWQSSAFDAVLFYPRENHSLADIDEVWVGIGVQRLPADAATPVGEASGTSQGYSIAVKYTTRCATFLASPQWKMQVLWDLKLVPTGELKEIEELAVRLS
ncbi:hypothetical protein GY45DRAFT_1374060 [Cubamyces sp. BRFM 1775]|nr:hypothetical protein GY45DRAFT_1374060 [Cubamyces sp. BRFM 1775]